MSEQRNHWISLAISYEQAAGVVLRRNVCAVGPSPKELLYVSHSAAHLRNKYK